MRHHNKNKKFGRTRDQRKALMKSLASALVERGKIKTTEAKAKELRPYIEKLVTRAIKGDLASRRLLISKIGLQTKKLVDDIAPKYKDRNGGYTRVIKLTPRASDASKMAVIEFV